jgi:hypothetical protein
VQNVGRPIRLAASARSDDVQLIGLTISPTHPALGRELRDIPLLSNLPARLGIGRARHLPGPDLGSVRLRAADSLLVAANDAAITELRANTNLIAEDTVISAASAGTVRRSRSGRWPASSCQRRWAFCQSRAGDGRRRYCPCHALRRCRGSVAIDRRQRAGADLRNAWYRQRVGGDRTIDLIVSAISPWLATLSPLG